jgi:hypothetical protein
LLGAGAGLLVLFVLLWLWLSVWVPGASGFIAGALAVGWCWAMVTVVQRGDGTWSRFRGAEAEEFTSSILRRLRRRGSFVIDAIGFDGLDIDHVVVGSGGAFAIETKWTSTEVTVTDDGVRGVYGGDPCHQARAAARKVKLLLKSNSIDLAVEPVLVLWGPGVPEIQGGYRRVGSVTIIEGRALKRCLDVFDGAVLSNESIDRCRRAIESYVARHDDYERAHW